jgi:secreted PhoX family phosphatase
MKRRQFVGVTGLSALSLFVQGCAKAQNTVQLPSHPGRQVVPKVAPPQQLGFGPLVNRPSQLLDLPAGFEFVVLQTAGDPLSDGHKMPQQPDGMACFMDEQGNYVLMRNHELSNQDFLKKYGYDLNPYAGGQVPKPHYTDGFFGSVTRLVVDKKQLAADLSSRPGQKSTAVMASNFALVGTDANCAGGQLPQGWVTCEESGRPEHGYAFLTKPTDSVLTKPRRISSWGRFPREAVALDPSTGIVYMTEDRYDGCFYRHVPTDSKQPLGSGRLQALSIKGLKTTSPYPKPVPGKVTPRLWKDDQTWTVNWVDIPDPSATRETCREQASARGATAFCRGEGIAWGGQSVWLCASLAGPVRAGQIFEYLPSKANSDTGKLILRYEVSDRSILSCPDNITMSPWHDLLMAEDNYVADDKATHQYLRCLDSEGRVYDVARNRNRVPGSRKPGGEFTGICFSSDKKYLFANIQSPENITIAIKGPWV